MSDEVIQEVSELVAWAKHHVAADQILLNNPQVEVIAKGVNMHQVPHLVTLLGEKHRELKQKGGYSYYQHKYFHNSKNDSTSKREHLRLLEPFNKSFCITIASESR